MNNKVSQETKELARQIMEETQLKLSALYGTPVSIMFRIKYNVISHNLLLQIVLSYFKIRYTDMVSDRRDNDVKIPRNIFCWLARGYCGLLERQIAEILHRDRSTISHSLQTVKDMIDSNDQLYMHPLNELENSITELFKENV